MQGPAPVSAPCTVEPWDHVPFTLALLGPAGKLNVSLSLLPLHQPDEDLFNPDYVEVDRILEVAHTKDSDTGEVSATPSMQLLFIWKRGEQGTVGRAEAVPRGSSVEVLWEGKFIYLFMGPAGSCGFQERWFQCSYYQVLTQQTQREEVLGAGG